MEQVVVITGGTSGIGQAVAEQLKNGGNTVLVLSKSCITNESLGQYACDVSNEEQVQETFARIGHQWGRIDVLINSAGFGVSGASELLPTKQVQSMFQVNVLGVLLCSKYALPYMHRGGKILNVASAMAFFPLPYRTLYAASKSAVVTLSEGMAMELKHFGIGVCAVCPGDVKTNFTKNRMKNFQTNEKYGTRIVSATTALDQKEDKRMPVSVVARAMVNLIKRNKVPFVQIIGWKYRVLYVLSKCLPTAWILWFIESHFSGK